MKSCLAQYTHYIMWSNRIRLAPNLKMNNFILLDYSVTPLSGQEEQCTDRNTYYLKQEVIDIAVKIKEEVNRK